MSGGQAWRWGWEIGVVGRGRWRVAWGRGRNGGWGEGSWRWGNRRWGWIGRVDMGVVGKVSRWAIGWGKGTIGGALGLHHGLQALEALS